MAVGAAGILLGGLWFAALAAFATGAMIWELAIMTNPRQRALAAVLGVLTGAAIVFARELASLAAVAAVAAPAVAGFLLLHRHRLIYLAYAIGVAVAGHGLAAFRDDHGALWLYWLVLVVVATDVAGYFGGRIIGGRKFWPAVSPGKTWAGVVSGWVAIVPIGLFFLAITDAGRDLIWISVLLSLASQIGDISESALKRRMGVKDSSNLLPGHGGLFDRFDGLLGASLFMLVVAQAVDVPELRF